MKVVIVGAGASGVLHALALRACGVRVEAVYDPDRARAHALADVCGGAVLASFDEAIALDAPLAAVCSPPSLHVAQAEALARAGRTVFVEKPVATSADDLQRLAALPGCVPVVQWRAGRALRALRRALAHGELGPAPVVGVDLAWARDDAYFDARGESWGCGALLSIGIHAVDAVAWALGRRIEGVSGMLHARRRGGGETAAIVLLAFAGGALASLRISLDGGANTTRITACGRGVTVTLEGGEGDPSASTLAWTTSDGATRARLEALERDTAGALGPPLLVPYLARAVDAVRRGLEPGSCEALPSIADVEGAHAAILAVVGFTRVSRAA
jgi:predicted dehydrogenase